MSSRQMTLSGPPGPGPLRAWPAEREDSNALSALLSPDSVP